MPSTDIILALDTHLAILITYNRDCLLPNSETVAVINEARSHIPTGVAFGNLIPYPLIYTSRNVYLTLSPQNQGMYWVEWEASLRALLWFREQYVALAMTFSVMDSLHGMAILGTGILGAP